jgi:hypothetical protein
LAFHHEPQEAGHALITSESWAFEQALKVVEDSLTLDLAGWH